MKRRTGTIVLACMLATTCLAQTARQDTTVTDVRIGYSKSNPNMVAGAIDKVTEERMNKGY